MWPWERTKQMGWDGLGFIIFNGGPIHTQLESTKPTLLGKYQSFDCYWLRDVNININITIIYLIHHIKTYCYKQPCVVKWVCNCNKKNFGLLFIAIFIDFVCVCFFSCQIQNLVKNQIQKKKNSHTHKKKILKPYPKKNFFFLSLCL